MAQDIFELPGPEGKYIVGSLVDLGSDPLGFLTQCAREYGDTLPMRLGLTPACLITNPDYIESVLKNRELFIKSRGFRVLKTLIDEGLLTAAIFFAPTLRERSTYASLRDTNVFFDRNRNLVRATLKHTLQNEQLCGNKKPGNY